MMKKNKLLISLSAVMIVMALAVVVLGAYTRLVDAGLGCPDWPTCYGHFWVPDSQEEIELANKNFEQTPVETDKTWPEQIHRIFASSLGLLILVFFFFVLQRERKNTGIVAWNTVTVLLVCLVLSTIARIAFGDVFEPFVALILLSYFLNVLRLSFKQTKPSILFRLTALLSGLVILQGLFGMWTVTLKLWPQVVTAHLLGGFATLSLIVLIWSLVTFPHFSIKIPSQGLIKKLLYLSCAMVIIQITLGGWTTSNYAALACPELPTCQSFWLPKTDFAGGFNIFQHVGPNYLGGQLDNDARVAIHLSHRIGAIFTVILVGGFCMLLLKQAKERTTKRFAAGVAATLLVQVGLGMSNIVFALPLNVAVAHNAVGALLLILMLLAVCRRRPLEGY